jgi:hypothetical protein
MGEALPRQDGALADRCAFAVMLARTRVWFRRLVRKNLRFSNAGQYFPKEGVNGQM